MPTLAEPATDTLDSPYVNPDAPPHGRRLKPVVVDAVLRGLRAGLPQHVLARAYGLHKDTVCRLAKRLGDSRFEEDADTLSELASLEDELQELGLPQGKIDLLVEAVRVGHLMRADRVRRSRQEDQQR